jgi:putative Mg2+ transporter-C (MgtC) family protein
VADPVSAFGVGEVLLRLGVATAVGAALGINRDLKNKPVGLRTLALVTLAGALLGLVGAYLELDDRGSFSRVIQGTVTGIGFLGAGVILRNEDRGSVYGLTTAAMIWLAAALGLACGAGYWRVSLITAALTLAVLVGGGAVEDVIVRWLSVLTDRKVKPPDAS